MKISKLFFVFFIFVLFINSGCKKSDVDEDYDIRGTWGFIITVNNVSLNVTMTFSGSKSSGTIQGENGSYSVAGDQVTITIYAWDIDFGDIVETFNGSFKNKDQMQGTAIFIYPDLNNQRVNGITWTATR